MEIKAIRPGGGLPANGASPGIFGHPVTFQLVVTRPPAYGRIRVAEQGADIVAVAAWLGDTVETVHRTYAHPIPDADDRGRKAMDQFFMRAGDEGSVLNVPSGGAV